MTNEKTFLNGRARRLAEDKDWLVCDDCGKRKADVEETNCPFAEDVHNDPNVPATLCGACYHERCMDI